MDWREVLFIMPARFIGDLLGPLFNVCFLLGGAAAGIFLGRIVFAYVRLPVVNWIAAIIVGGWLFVVLSASGKYTAAAWIHSFEARDDY